MADATLLARTGVEPMLTRPTPDSLPRRHAATPTMAQSCARRLRDTGDVEAAGRLVLSHLRLVVSVSRQYLGYGLPQGDLIQEGQVPVQAATKRMLARWPADAHHKLSPCQTKHGRPLPHQRI